MRHSIVYAGIAVDDVRFHRCRLDQCTGEVLDFHCRLTLKDLVGQLEKLREYFCSVAAYNSALAERTRDRVPEDWAMTQNNLGATLQKLGERTQDPQILERSIAAYENALQEWSRERMPMNWAMTMANRGIARKTLAEQTQNIEVARLAVSDFAAVSEVFRNASHAQYYELSEEQRAKTLKLLKKLEWHDG